MEVIDLTYEDPVAMKQAIMESIKDNRDIACYFITKHSWKGKYKRIFSVGTHGITTYNLNTLEITNRWPYSDFISIVPNNKAPTNNEFSITMRKGQRKVDTMRFSTDHRPDLLTEALRFRKLFAEQNTNIKRFNAFKYHWSETRVTVILEVNSASLDQLDPVTNRLLASYDYKDMEGLTLVNSASLDQLDPVTNRLLASYDYKDMEGLTLMSDYPGGVAVVYGGNSRLHLFVLDQRDQLVKSVMEAAANNIGISVKCQKEAITFDHFLSHKFGNFSSDECLTSYTEFTVQKISPRHTDCVRRTLCLTENCLVERDPATYNVVTCKPLCDIFAIIRYNENPQRFSVEYVKGEVRTYQSTDRDALLASLLDGVRASGNRDVCVKMSATKRGYRLGPFTVPVDEEVESQHLRFIHSPPTTMSHHEAVERFNCNTSYSGLMHAVTQDGLFAENKEKLINAALSGLLGREGDQANNVSSEALEAEFQALRRLVASKAGFQAFTSLPKMRERVGVKVVKALKRNDDAVTHAAVDMLCALMQPMHDDYDIRQEQMNKYSLMSSRKFLESLLEMFNYHVVHATGALVISSMLDFLTFALCAPYSETTEGAHFDTMLEMVAANGRIVFKLFQHPSMAIVKGAGLVMKAIIEEGDAEIAAKMQDLALGEGALPKHLHTAMFTQGADSRMLTNRQLSRHLVGLWVTGHPTAMHLLGRIMPSGLLAYLDSTDEVPTVEEDKLHVRDNVKLAQDRQNRHKKNPQLQLIEKKIDHFLQHWRAQMGLESSKKQNDVKPIVLRKRRQRIKSEANWLLFYYHFNHDHARPNLIWNYKTREELREALENEMRSFNVDRELGSNHVIAWNHQEFEVPFNCLSDEIKIGDYYLRLLLEEGEESTETLGIKRSYEFFNDLYHRFLLTTKTPMKCMCLQAMAIVYGKCHQEIGPFNDTRYIIGMLDRCTDRLERDRLILFINKLILHTKNIKEILDSNGIKILVDLLTLAHLHTSRAVVPLQSNLLEAGVDMKRESEKEWYYGNADKERLGPYSYEEMKALWNDNVINGKTRCWAQGMDGWRSLQCVTQLKWKLLATSQPVMNETELAKLILSMLIRIVEHYPSRDIDGAIVRPLPRAKRLLSDATSLPHIVQLLLTFDPALVERVAILLYEVMQDNPNVSRLYLTGVFYFIMMYTGCNVLPVARFLKYTHLKQAFRSEENKTSDIMVRSVMGHLLPEAMVCYLENYSAERFAEIFLGEFDTPEAIWSNEMRRMMIEKIASHLADFSPRLQSNTRALYQYCPIPVISFPQLENELFCNIYYLKHLCDTMNFPDWPIKDPVRLLKDILDAWKKEVEKKPPSMSVEEAYQVLNLNKAPLGHDESKVRKAYFRLAQKYHPDKNPDGREMFEKVNKAYEFLCSKKKKATQGPDPENIVLILKAQSILFKRHKNVLEPYKYAGYPMLIKTIKMETQDETLFSKSAPLLAAASETAYYTVNCSALNAEELRRENGIEALQDAFTRCVDVLSLSTTPDDVAAQVCMHVTQCYSVASQFEGCREKIQEMACIIRDLTKILFYKNLQNLCSEVAACISSFCIDYWLQTHLYQAGVIWSLLLYMFQYDYTLAESGIEKSKDSNQQEESNQLACLCVVACARLAGYNSTNDENPCPDNPAVKKSLLAMLTPYLARKLANENPFELLKLLNSNTENPYLIWNNSTRTQLSEYLTDQQSKKKWYLDSSFSADHFLKIAEMGECDPDYGSKFVFKEHEKELIVGEIFVRVYNDQPTFVLENPKGFTIDLLDFLGSEAQYLYSLMALQQQNRSFGSGQGSSDRLRNVEMALEALRNVIRNNPGVEIQCIGHFKLLFSLLRLENCAKLQQCTLEVINSVTTNQECVNDIAASEILSYLLLAIQGLPQCHLLILETLFALMSNTKIVKEALSKGALVYLLDLFCNSTNPLVREKTSELFAKMLGDKLVGPKVRIILAKFLPGIFMDAMRDSPDASVHMFEGTHENPELIWNDDAREKVCDLIKKLKAQHYRSQRDNPDTRWSLPDDFSMVYSDVQGELAIGGVFLRLFIANPGWVLRKPKEFLTELMEKWVRLLEERSPDGEVLETVTMALVCLFQSQVPLLDQVPGLGYIPHIFQVMHSKNPAIPKSAIQVLNQLTNSELCIRSMSAIDCIGSLKIGMKCRKDMMVFAAECLAKMFEKAEEELVSQALKHEMIPFLLSVLQNPLESTENPAATKAQIVKALKCMQRSLLYGEQVTSLLEKSAVWKEYKDQKHDLFLSDSTISGYLTGPGVAGYLTSGVRPNLPDAPPPLDTSHQEDFH